MNKANRKQISQDDVSQYARSKKDYIEAAEKNGYLLPKGARGLLNM